MNTSPVNRPGLQQVNIEGQNDRAQTKPLEKKTGRTASNILFKKDVSQQKGVIPAAIKFWKWFVTGATRIISLINKVAASVLNGSKGKVASSGKTSIKGTLSPHVSSRLFIQPAVQSMDTEEKTQQLLHKTAEEIVILERKKPEPSLIDEPSEKLRVETLELKVSQEQTLPGKEEKAEKPVLKESMKSPATPSLKLATGSQLAPTKKNSDSPSSKKTGGKKGGKGKTRLWSKIIDLVQKKNPDVKKEVDPEFCKKVVNSIICQLQNVKASEVEGVFRESGLKSILDKFTKSLISQSIQFENEGPGNSLGSILLRKGKCQLETHDLAVALKRTIRELAPLEAVKDEFFELGSTHYKMSLEEKDTALKHLLEKIDPNSREVLRALMEYLGEVLEKTDKNKMTPSNLAVCIAPNVYRDQLGGSNLDPFKVIADQKNATEAFQLMIERRKQLFNI